MSSLFQPATAPQLCHTKVLSTKLAVAIVILLWLATQLAEKLALEECMAALEGSGLTADVAGGGVAALVLGAYILKYRNVLVF